MNPVNGTAKQGLELEPLQLAALLVLDGCCINLKTGIDQLGGFLGLKREADILAERLKDLVREKEKLIEDWKRKVKLVSAAEMPPPPRIIPSMG